VPFEFAHLLDPMSYPNTVEGPHVVEEAHPAGPPHCLVDTEPASISDPTTTAGTDVPDSAPDPIAPAEPEPQPVSRFAAAGLDDDRLPLVVKGRGRRKLR
jgi:hypothetical protein